jgi:hypothetical protein
MHCSGTSATAGLLSLLGVDMGPPEVAAPARRTNTKGLWEHPRLTRIGEWILRALGGSWDRPPPLEPGWQAAPELDRYREAARTIVERLFATSPLWGWKDPRNSLLVPFWQDLLGPMHHVVCARHPEDVAASLGKRDGMERDRALGLWLRYTRDLLDTTADRPRIVTFYEDLWSGPEVFSRLATFIGRPEAVKAPGFQAAAEEWLDIGMWNNRAGRAPDGGDLRGLPPAVAQLYESLLDMRRAPGPEAGRHRAAL